MDCFYTKFKPYSVCNVKWNEKTANDALGLWMFIDSVSVAKSDSSVNA